MAEIDTKNLYLRPGRFIGVDGDPQDYQTKKATTIYLSGPMSGLPNFNADEFAKYAAKYRALGWVVKSPPELDGGDFTKPYEEYIRRDVRVLLEEGIDRVYLLPGWQKSRGANLEVHLSKMFKIPIYDTQTDKLFVESVTQEAYRLVNGERGETYSHPAIDFSRTASMVSGMLNHKLKEPLTPQDIALLMVCVKLSRLVNSPDHRDSAVDIAGYIECYWMVKEWMDARSAKQPGESGADVSDVSSPEEQGH